MDKYLRPCSAYDRLWAEYNKYGKLIVCCDFDDTLYDYHKDGGTYDQVKQLVRDLKSIGFYIIIWTGNRDVDFITKYLNDSQVPFDSINEPDIFRNEPTSRKIYANVYIDDRSGLYQVYSDLTKLISKVKSNV